MSYVTISHFSDHVPEYVREVRTTDEVVVVTRNSRPEYCLYGVVQDAQTGVVRGRGRFQHRRWERTEAFGDVVSVRDLSRSTFPQTRRLSDRGEPLLVTHEGKPAAAMQKIDDTTVIALAMAFSPEIRDNIRQAEEDLAAGRTRPIEDVLDELREARRAKDDSSAPTGSE